MAKDLRIKLKIDSDTGELIVTQREFGKLSKAIDKTSEVSKAFNQTLKNTAGYAIGFITITEAVSGLKSIINDFIGTSSQFEKYGSTLETIEGSFQKAKESLSWIQDFAKNTPYELAQVTEAFVQMRAYGLTPIDGSLKSLGDAASAMNKPLIQAVEAMADAMTGENERLKEFGIKASTQGDEIAYNWTDSSGKAKHIIIKNNSEIIQSTIEAIFNSKYQGAMQNQMNTWNGIVSNMRDNYVNFGNAIMNETGAFEGLKNTFRDINTEFSKITEGDNLINLIRETKSLLHTVSLLGGSYLAVNTAIKAYSVATVTATALTTTFQGGILGLNSALVLTAISTKALDKALQFSALGVVIGGIALLAESFIEGKIRADNLGKSVDELANSFEMLDLKARLTDVNRELKDLDDRFKNYNDTQKLMYKGAYDLAYKEKLQLEKSIELIEKKNKEQERSKKNQSSDTGNKLIFSGAVDGQFQFGSAGTKKTEEEKAAEKEKKRLESEIKRALKEEAKAINEAYEDKRRMQEQFTSDYMRSQLTQSQYQIYELNNQYADYAKYIDDKVALDKWYESEKKEILKNRAEDEKNWLDGVNEAFDDYIEHAGNSYRQMNNLFSNALYGMEDFLVDFIKTGKASFSDFINSIAEDFIRMMVQINITKPLATAASSINWGSMFSGFAFANGGIMTNQGAVPLKTYANGGVASTPQLALFGEGRMPEAYVPLPDGRTIPVTMKGGNSGTNIVLNIENKTGQAIDASQISQMTKIDSEGKKTEIISIVMDAYNRNTMQLRDLLKGGR